MPVRVTVDPPHAVERVIPTGHLGALDDPAVFNAPLVEFLDAQP